MYARPSGNKQKEYGLSIRFKTRKYESLVLNEYQTDYEYSFFEPICGCENPSRRNDMRLFPQQILSQRLKAQQIRSSRSIAGTTQRG
jgi:hypothetical protein